MGKHRKLNLPLQSILSGWQSGGTWLIETPHHLKILTVVQKALQIGDVPRFKETVVDRAPKKSVHFSICYHQSSKPMRVLLLLELYQKHLK